MHQSLIGNSEFRTFFVAMVISIGMFDLLAVAILAGISSGDALLSLIVLGFGWVLLIAIIPIAGLVLLVPSALTFTMSIDLPPLGPSFITRVCRLDLGIPVPRLAQARRAQSPQFAQASGALAAVSG